MDGRISNFGQVASLRRYTVSDGRGRGLEVIDCDNGKIRFLLNASKALEISDRAYVLENGAITLTGTGLELSQSDEVRKAYLGG